MTDLKSMAAAHARGEVNGEGAATDGVATRRIEQGEIVTSSDVDLSDSGIEADAGVPVHVAWSRVMGEVQYVAKGRSEGLRYEFRGIDAVLDAVAPAFRKHGVFMLPVSSVPTYDQVPTSGGKSMQRARVTVGYRIYGPAGDFLPDLVEVPGESFDSGDKATPKAMSVALRTALIQALAIPVHQPEMDPEHGPQYEVVTPPPPTAGEYREMLLNPGISRARAGQIYQELTSNKAVAVTEVATPDGQGSIRLIDLVRQIGEGLSR